MGWGGKGGGACLFVWAAMTLGSFSLHPHPPTHIHIRTCTHSPTYTHATHAPTLAPPRCRTLPPYIHAHVHVTPPLILTVRAVRLRARGGGGAQSLVEGRGEILFLERHQTNQLQRHCEKLHLPPSPSHSRILTPNTFLSRSRVQGCHPGVE